MNTNEVETPWLDLYPKGVNPEINADHYHSLLELFEEAFQKYKNLVAYECMGATLTYHELDQYSTHFAAYLQKELGLKKGDRIAIQMPNLLQYPIAMIGSIKAGLIVVNTNPLYTEREMEHQFKDSGAKAIVVLSNFASKLEDVIDNTSIEHIILTSIGEFLPFPKGAIVNTVVKHIKKMVPSYNLPKGVFMKKAIKLGKKQTLTPQELSSDDIAFLQYTGGTTGVSKGAMLTHRNMVANLEQNTEWMTSLLKEKEEIAITALPLYHIFSLTVNCLTMMKIGARNILITNPRDIPAFVKELKRHPFSIITGVNTLFNALLNNEDFQKLNFSKVKVAIGGGMAVQKAVAIRWKEITGSTLTEGYGLTESAPVLCCNPLQEGARIGSIGLPFPSTMVAIRDDEGNFLNQGERGELCALGPQVMKGYWKREEETAKVFHKDDWLRTGDIAVMDEDGYFRIVDRKKDMINVSGFNVYPNEIEDVVALHPNVLEVAAIGIPDEKSSEAVKLFVVKKEDYLTTEELKAYCKENLTGYKVPKHYEFTEELPKTNVGKILRRKLKERELKKMASV
ncbi:long-chain acyl-CoA synthetase [Sediminitomix flava]|uniref:Long-chain-fatty-acid--CoA ligase n=2 Tax=Sediminitomix flava TaxID=379075 RepID=A0A315ZEP1_SEDFL|nr:AMP-binding protein [Sediminitomix flava]PWJ44066.1 long-chain acyl-CoA synthetase [Sediminitomix flava]